MVDTSGFTEVGGQIISKIMSGAVWIVGGLVAGSAIAFLMYWFLIYKRKFDIEIKIISQRAGNRNNIIFDRAAILTERKTGKRFFRLWKFKLDLPVPKFEVLQRAGNTDYLEIYQKSDEDFFFLTPARIDKTKIIKSDGKLIPFAEQEHKLMDTDIAYWNVKRKVTNKGIFSKDKVWMKVLELAPQILSIIALIFILWIFLDKLPPILSQLQGVAAEINKFNKIETATTTIANMFPLFLKWKK